MRRVGLSLALLLASTAGAQISPPRTRVQSCTTAGCHAAETKHEFMHGPTAVSACDACHEYADPAQHTFKLKREGKDLCIFCHIDQTGDEGPVVHAPVAEGKCVACHDPHGGSTRDLLRGSSLNTTCLACHAGTMKGTHTHRPAAEDCTACHQAHTAEHPRLLRAPSAELCASCHQDVFKAVSTLAHPHEPAKGDCLTCHSPHASDSIRILKQPPKDLCISCHSEVGRTISVATHPHSATTDERACLNCHSAHASDHAAQLLKDTAATCLQCHAKPVTAAKGRVVAAVAELAEPGMILHGPAQHGDCSACHTVHGGALTNFLVEPYPASFYLTYSEDAYALCFKCHDKALIETATDDVRTKFRDGSRNLHAVHVAGGPQGRSCRACHAVHASRYRAMVADTVTFGQWKLPINFTPTPTGGSCAPGCHKAESYDRERPGAPPPQAPGAAAPSNVPPGAPAGIATDSPR